MLCANCKYFKSERFLSGFCQKNKTKIKNSTDPKEACAYGEREENKRHIVTQDMPISKIKASNFVLRKLDEETVSELALNISQNGLLQPIMIREIEKAEYEIVFGNHRFEACRRLGWTTIPSIVDKMSEEEAIFLQVTENIQRNIKQNVIKEGEFYSHLHKKGWSTYQIAKKIGKSAVYVQDRMSIADKLHPSLHPLINHNQLNASLAHRIAELPPERQIKISEEAISKNWRVRDFEINVRGRLTHQCKCLLCPIHAPMLQKHRKKPPENELYLAGTWVEIRANAWQDECCFCGHTFEPKDYSFPLRWKSNLTSYLACESCALAHAPESFTELFYLLKRTTVRSISSLIHGNPRILPKIQERCLNDGLAGTV